jgi:hypothetical protein
LGAGDSGGSFGSALFVGLLAFGAAVPDMFLLLVRAVCFGGPSNGFAETGFGIGFFGVSVRPFCFGAGLFGGDPFIGAAERVDFFVSLKSSTRPEDRLRPKGDALG